MDIHLYFVPTIFNFKIMLKYLYILDRLISCRKSIIFYPLITRYIPHHAFSTHDQRRERENVREGKIIQTRDRQNGRNREGQGEVNAQGIRSQIQKTRLRYKPYKILHPIPPSDFMLSPKNQKLFSVSQIIHRHTPTRVWSDVHTQVGLPTQLLRVEMYSIPQSLTSSNY